MYHSLELINGGAHLDERGEVAFVNEFDLSPIVRFYRIIHHETSIIRAWQGHKKESKWFHCLSGSFVLKFVKIDDWKNPSLDLEIDSIELKGTKPQVLSIPPGYVTGFRAIKKNSSIMIFSNMSVEESINDDFRFEKNYWFKWDAL